MINLLALFKKYNVQLLFILLEAAGFILVFNFKNYHKASFINSANEISGGTFSAVQNVGKYFSLSEQNNLLSEENARLRAQIPSGLKALNGDYYQVKDTLFKQRYIFRVANVVSNSTHKPQNYLTLDLGRNDGIMSDMGVIAPGGVVGVVGAVSNNYCTVMSFLHPKMDLSCKIKRNSASGWLKWQGGDYQFAQIKDVPITTKVYEGDTIVTSGYSSIFPAGIVLGTVVKVSDNEENQTQGIKVALDINFNALGKVYIVENLFKDELDALKKEENALNE